MQVQHPNCINLYAVYITPRKVYLVTELVTGGELLDRYAPAHQLSSLRVDVAGYMYVPECLPMTPCWLAIMFHHVANPFQCRVLYAVASRHSLVVLCPLADIMLHVKLMQTL